MQFLRRLISAVSISFAVLTATAGCSGGGTQNVVPGAPAQPASVAPLVRPLLADESLIPAIQIDRAAAASYRVTRASAYASPINGRKPQNLGLRSIRSTSPNDLSYFGGPVVASEQNINIYVNCGNSCWGGTSPAVFERNLAASSFVHIIDQYVGSTANGRYPFGGSVTENYDTSVTLQDQDIYNLVYAAASSYGSGYGKMYHVFLQDGVSQCSQNAGGCYAQQYCAYHGNTDFSDIGHVIYSVEPYQGISGCQASTVVDSTASTLSHEMFEAITDPDVPQNVAWYNNSLGEIGDICAQARGYVGLNGTTYYIQSEYSNYSHACTFSP